MLRTTQSKAGAVAVVALCTMAGLTTLTTARAQVDRDAGRPIAALAAIAIASPAPAQDPAAAAPAKAEKPPDAGDDGGLQKKSRLLKPEGGLICLNLYTTDPKGDLSDLVKFGKAFVNRLFWRVGGSGLFGRILGDRITAVRIRLSPDRMRAHNLSSEDIIDALGESTLHLVNDRLGQAMRKPLHSKENELISITNRIKPEQYENFILKANPDGEILRLKEVGQAELAHVFSEIGSDVDGHPAVAIILKSDPGSNGAKLIEVVKEELEHTKKESCPPGMKLELIPLDSQDMIYAIIETPRGSTLEFTRAKCHALGAIARGIDGITSVTSLAGYQIRTEERGPDVATCLIPLKNRSDPNLTSRMVIEKLDEKCRTLNVHFEFFEPPAVSVFVAPGNFSVRVLDKTRSNHNEPSGKAPDTLMDDLLNRESLASLFNFLDSKYPEYELVINNDVARTKGVSIAKAMENLSIVVGGDAPAERKLRSFAEDLSQLFVKNDRGETIPYSSFMQLKRNPWLIMIDR
jgi:multidrug efflux pump subunit AcrB